jgi:hypothetical protein
MNKLRKKITSSCLAGFLYVTYMGSAYAEDILAEHTKDLFDTFVKTGINIILVIEIISASYLFSARERSLKTWMGLPIIILVTTYAKLKFAG